MVHQLKTPRRELPVASDPDSVSEIICDGHHVHPATARLAIDVKRPKRVMAITDGTSGSGLPKGSTATLGGYRITLRDAAYLDDGTIAGSTLTMDRAFAKLVSAAGLSLSDAATVCWLRRRRCCGGIASSCEGAGRTRARRRGARRSTPERATLSCG